MLMTIEELRRIVSTDETDEMLAMRLKAVELFIRGYTHSNFVVHGTGRIADIVGGVFTTEEPHPYEIGDTVQVIRSDKNGGLYTVKASSDNSFTVNEKTRDEIDAYVMLVEYPEDVKLGAAQLLKYDMENRDNVNVQSESISRHSVTYKAMDESNSDGGYPLELLGFLRRHMRARFGQGLRT